MWLKVGSGLFSVNNNHYLIITDYYSLWSEVYELSKTESEHVIDALILRKLCSLMLHFRKDYCVYVLLAGAGNFD